MNIKNLGYFIVIAICISSCATTTYFKTPNDLYKTAGTIYFNDGSERKGLITILFENGIDFNNDKVQFIPAGSTTEENVDIKNIERYTVNGQSYFPKHVDLYFKGTNHLLFVKRMTPDTSKIHLYVLHQAYKSNDTGEDADYYFLSFRGSSKYEVISIVSEKLLPNFDLKMSALVADCPSLADVIRGKDKDYYYSTISFNAHKLKVLNQIIDDYNACK